MLKYSMIVKRLTEHHLESISLKGGCRGLSESTNVKMPHCWKSHAVADMFYSEIQAIQFHDLINHCELTCCKENRVDPDQVPT